MFGTRVCAIAALLVAGAAGAAELIVYPAKGQSPAQVKKDRYECHEWAVGETGFDPASASPPPATTTSTTPGERTAGSGALVRGAARGAAVGAVGGAIAGDAGKGAAVGAGTGALVGGFRHRDASRPQTTTQTNPDYARYQEAQTSYGKAMKACLSARGYSVE